MSYVLTDEKRQAYLIRLPGKIMKEKNWALSKNVLNMGWELAAGLDNNDLCYEDFREIIHKNYFPGDDNYRRSGRVAGNAWRFINEMAVGNYVLMSVDEGYIIGKITSDAYFDYSFLQADRGYKRTVKWLNNGKPVKDDFIPPKLQNKSKTSQSVTEVSDLIQEIEYSLRSVT
jgi:predicted Mrr-cat superfamily restriction endonuclease